MITNQKIPMPEKSNPNLRGDPKYYFVNEMKVGDCVVFLFSDKKWRTKYETVVKKIKRKGWTPVQRKDDDRMIVWRFD